MRALLAAAIAAVLLLLPAVSFADVQVKARNCGGYIYGQSGPVGVRIARGTTSCSTARRIMRTYLNSNKKCGGSACVRKHSGWTCGSAAAIFYPLVASCGRGRQVIEAWAIVD